MSRKLVSIQKVWSVEPIEGADRIELAHVLGWQCVVNKGQFKPMDLAVYFQIDSYVCRQLVQGKVSSTTAERIAECYLAATDSPNLKSVFHDSLEQMFGIKLGNQHYKKAAKILRL